MSYIITRPLLGIRFQKFGLWPGRRTVSVNRPKGLWIVVDNRRPCGKCGYKNRAHPHYFFKNWTSCLSNCKFYYIVLLQSKKHWGFGIPRKSAWKFHSVRDIQSHCFVYFTIFAALSRFFNSWGRFLIWKVTINVFYELDFVLKRSLRASTERFEIPRSVEQYRARLWLQKRSIECVSKVY